MIPIISLLSGLKGWFYYKRLILWCSLPVGRMQNWQAENAACSIQGQWSRELMSCIWTNNLGEASPKPFLFVFGIGNRELDHPVNPWPGWEQTQRWMLSLPPTHLFSESLFSFFFFFFNIVTVFLSWAISNPRCHFQVMLLVLWCFLPRWGTWLLFQSPPCQALQPATSELWPQPLVPFWKY